jgi:hypothetical protein
MNKRFAVPLWQLILMLGVTLTLAACDRSAFTVSTTVENAARAAETALARDRNLSTVQPFFATVEDGANPAGLDETWGALGRFAASLDNSTRVQFHSFDVVNTKVHENGGLATATYRLHLSVLRNGEVVFNAIITQNLALMKSPRGWLIGGGDEPQLSEVQGQWPLPSQ